MSPDASAGPVRRLLVLRHAKSEWPNATPDHQRPLAARGRRDAPAAGAWLRDHGPVPEVVLCSTARRAKQTWSLVAAELAPSGPPEARFEDRIYDADVADLVEVLRETPDEAGTVLMVGHNPGFQELTLLLAAGGEGDALDRLALKFPTSGIAVLTVDVPWSELRFGAASLTEFVVPRG